MRKVLHHVVRYLAHVVGFVRRAPSRRWEFGELGVQSVYSRWPHTHDPKAMLCDGEAASEDGHDKADATQKVQEKRRAEPEMMVADELEKTLSKCDLDPGKLGEALNSSLASLCKASGERNAMVEDNRGLEDLNNADMKFAKQLECALAAGKVDITGALGQIFQRAFKPGTSDHEALKQQRSMQDKATFRLEWAKTEYEKLNVSKSHGRQWEKVDQEKGTYLPSRVIARKEGGGCDDFESAVRYCTKCARTQGKWISWNAMTERYEFLYIRRQHVEVYKESWRMFEFFDELKRCPTPPGTQGTNEVKKAMGDKKEERGELVSKFENFEKEKGKEKAKATATPPKEKQEIDKKLSQAMRLKSEFLAVTSAASELLAAIDSSGEWSWAKNEQNQGVLRQVLLGTQASITTDLRKVFLAQAGELKKELKQDSLMIFLSKFIEVVYFKMTILQKQRALLMKRHSV